MRKAILCDLDGTLALLNGRNPYDTARCGGDTLCVPIANILRSYWLNSLNSSSPSIDAPAIIICSGRFDTFERHTRQWLEDNDVPFDHLFLRKAGDKRMDAIIKQEILFDKIFGELEIEEIEFVLDDRQQVVDMWRAHGFPCFQVAPSPD